MYLFMSKTNNKRLRYCFYQLSNSSPIPANWLLTLGLTVKIFGFSFLSNKYLTVEEKYLLQIGFNGRLIETEYSNITIYECATWCNRLKWNITCLVCSVNYRYHEIKEKYVYACYIEVYTFITNVTSSGNNAQVCKMPKNPFLKWCSP